MEEPNPINPPDPQSENLPPVPVEEPSVLDFVLSWVMFWKGEKIHLPPLPEKGKGKIQPEVTVVIQPRVTPSPLVAETAVEKPPRRKILIPWRALLAVVLALTAQQILDTPERTDQFNFWLPVILYILAAGMIVWAALAREWDLAALPDENEAPMSDKVRFIPLIASIVPMVFAFLTFKGNEFTFVNLTLWAVTMGLVLWGVWLPGEKKVAIRQRVKDFIKNPNIQVKISPWVMVVVLFVLVAVFFRFYRLNEVPAEMFSDHAEKLYDVQDLLGGKHAIFFERNTGREAFQFYLTALVIQLFGTGITFLSLKLGTVIAGVVTLPFIYLLGKEIGNRWVGLLAFLLAGVAYWPNVIDRVALRFALYPLFAAPTLYFFIRGLRRSSRRDMIFAGIALGLGLHGYSPFRFVPFVLAAGLGIYLLHRQAKGKRWQAIIGFFVLALVAFVVFLPLFRYGFFDNPEMYSYRAFTRLGDAEASLPAPAMQIFLENLGKAMVMPFWDNGEIWVHSIPHRPALDVVSAALYFIGTVLMLVRYVRRRTWVDLFMLVSVPLLMMPSILSLAFPAENPSLNRTGGAIIPIFIIAAFGLEALLTGIKQKVAGRLGAGVSAAVGGVLILCVLSGNFTLVFDKFDKQFKAGAWNTSQIGEVIRSYVESVGEPDTAYVIPFPYWVDTRLVGINAGFPTTDFALSHEYIADTLNDPRTKLFILKEEDVEHLEELKQMYPNAVVKLHLNPLEGKNFYSVLVPGTEVTP